MSRSVLDSVLDSGSVESVFQPVFEMNESEDQTHAVHFVECLARGPKGTNIESAGVLFDYARRKGRETSLDRVCIENALRAISGSGYRPALSLNVHTSTLEEPDFPDFLARLADRAGVPPSRMTLEIVEHGREGIGPALEGALSTLRRLGVRIALDDIGLGQSNYRRILDYRPDYFKLDRYLIQGCHADPARGALLESLVLLARRMGARIVAEGVETPEELFEVCARGIDLIQGFLLAKPTPAEGLGALIDDARRETRRARGKERKIPMAVVMHVNVYCANPDCDFRGSTDAESYVAGGAARRCPDCGAAPMRIEIPGRPSPPRSYRATSDGAGGATGSTLRPAVAANS
jgi:EAL domain-containing protein (putative c-di-GMP-specific phosphodiesterase class I)